MNEEKMSEIIALKSLLANSDYNSNKVIESLVNIIENSTSESIIENLINWAKTDLMEYKEIFSKRAEWRRKINEYEEELED